MVKKVKIFGLLLSGLWAGCAYSSTMTPLPEELSFVDKTTTEFQNDMLMGAVQSSSQAPQTNSQVALQNVNIKNNFAQTGDEKDSRILYQPDALENQDIFLNFEDADLASVASYMENIHNVTFITDDVVKSTTATTSTGSGLQGHKVSFRMFKSVNKRQSWNLFVTFLKMAGLDLIPMTQPGFYKIVSFATALNEALPTYIGVDASLLPDNDMMVRYVYFLQNSDPASIQTLVSQLQGSTGKLEIYSDLKALIFVDKSYNIRSLMKIVVEMDKSTAPQVVSVIKLQRALAADVITLYNSLKPTETTSERAWDPVKKESSLQYFPSDIVLTADARTNSLILLGTESAVTRVENFIKKYVDEEIDHRDSPVHVYRLEYTNAADIKTVLASVIQYGSGTTTATYGGTLNGEKYFSPMTIVSDDKTNSLIINSTKRDYESLEQLIKKLDVPQKQVAFDILLLQVTDVDTRILGSQITGSIAPDGTPGASNFLSNVSAQTSGVPSGTSVVQSSGNLKTSLASLITGTSNLVNTAGSTLVTFGQSIWGLLKIVKTIGSTQIIANPFIVTTNNTAGTIKIGTTRQVKNSEVFTTSSTSVASSYSSQEATLNVTITPQVNDNNIINLNIVVDNTEFTVSSSADASNGNTSTKNITTTASIAAGEVLVLGGIVKENVSSAGSGVPFLEKIPVFGWLFKSRSKTISKDHFVIFIAPRIIDATTDAKLIDDYTQQKIEQAHSYLDLMNDLEMASVLKDPITKGMFSVNRPTEIALLGEDRDAYKSALQDRHNLIESVKVKAQQEENIQKTRKGRRAAKKIGSQKQVEKKVKNKKRRTKNKFSQDNSLQNQSIQKNVSSIKSSKNDTAIDSWDMNFIEEAFPLNADTIEGASIYDSLNSTQGDQNA